ncbi:hypothetical protein GLAREA_12809 [Glarea lozoyensis ATCC 20868]|uniref:Ubiquitin 3 binding protein But2 C-terminal domain-containing protein n=1 Tax=Glarea lozoyensis (strain ATCC 20868 / MF5171) TaxID=1116229 RepID=S3DDM3_GLAL2|nr:uncharacterized protein GLAREA_12809 [Glarea lozoyensis ATCC 20868]EPE30086.1 hypothetical protein GLAREA_12809 [Glarea lozoyensis ATCC 20868]
MRFILASLALVAMASAQETCRFSMSVQSTDPLGAMVGKNVVRSGNGTILVDEIGGGKVMRFVNEGEGSGSALGCNKEMKRQDADMISMGCDGVVTRLVDKALATTTTRFITCKSAGNNGTQEILAKNTCGTSRTLTTFKSTTLCHPNCPNSPLATPTTPSIFTPYTAALLATSSLPTSTTTTSIPTSKTGCPIQLINSTTFVPPSLILPSDTTTFQPFNHSLTLTPTTTTSLYFSIPLYAPFSYSRTCTLIYLQDALAPVIGPATSNVVISALSEDGSFVGEIARATLGRGSQGIVNFACGGGMGVVFEVAGEDGGEGGGGGGGFGFVNSYMAPAVGFFLSVCV